MRARVISWMCASPGLGLGSVLHVLCLMGFSFNDTSWAISARAMVGKVLVFLIITIGMMCNFTLPLLWCVIACLSSSNNIVFRFKWFVFCLRVLYVLGDACVGGLLAFYQRLLLPLYVLFSTSWPRLFHLYCMALMMLDLW